MRGELLTAEVFVSLRLLPSGGKAGKGLLYHLLRQEEHAITGRTPRLFVFELDLALLPFKLKLPLLFQLTLKPLAAENSLNTNQYVTRTSALLGRRPLQLPSGGERY